MNMSDGIRKVRRHFRSLEIFIRYNIFGLFKRTDSVSKNTGSAKKMIESFQFEGHRLHHFLEKSHAEFGDVFTVFTPRPLVVLMSYATIKDALVTKGLILRHLLDADKFCGHELQNDKYLDAS